MFCMQCGTQLPAEAAFCFKCGAQMGSQSASPPTPTPSPAVHRVERADITLVAVTCPVCGGPIGSDDSRCAYCGSVVVIKMDMPRIDPGSLKLAVIDQHILEYRTAVRRDPNDETAHYGLGIAYYNLRLLEEATSEIEEAVRLMPENPNIQFQLSLLYGEMMAPRAYGQPMDRAGSEALKRVNRTLTIRPTMVEAILFKAALYSDNRYFDLSSLAYRDAAEELRAALRLWEMAHNVDPNAIRRPIATFLRQSSIQHPGSFPIVLCADILRAAPQFKVKSGMFGPDRAKLDQVERELQEFYAGSVVDSRRLLSAAKYVIDVVQHRLSPSLTTAPIFK